MSQKYHVKPDETIGICRTERKRCPYQSAPHFSSEQEAQNYVSEQNKREFGLLGIHKQQSSKTYIKNIQDKIRFEVYIFVEELKKNRWSLVYQVIFMERGPYWSLDKGPTQIPPTK